MSERITLPVIPLRGSVLFAGVATPVTIGREASLLFAREGARVVVLIRDWVPESKLIDTGLLSRTRVLRGELEDLGVLMRALNEYEVDTVFHLGAQTVVGAASRSPLSTFEANIRGTWNVLEQAERAGAKRVIVTSSDSVVGYTVFQGRMLPPDYLPVDSDHPLRPTDPYALSKLLCERMAESFARLRSMV